MSQLPDPLDSQYKILSQKKLHKVLVGAGGAISIKKMSLPERLFKSVLRKGSYQYSIWKIAWTEFGRTKGAFWMSWIVRWFAFGLFTFGGFGLYGIAKWFFPFLPLSWWIVASVVSFALGQAFVIHYSGIAYERTKKEKVDELEERIYLLEDRLHPTLKIVFDPDSSEHFVQPYVDVTQYRVAGISPVPLVDAELVANCVRLIEVQVEGNNVDLDPILIEQVHSKLYLRPMHDRNPEGTRRVKMRAHEQEYWDLFSVTDEGGVTLNHIEGIKDRRLAVGKHEFELMLSGGERPSATKIVLLEVFENNIKFTLRDGRLSRPIAS